MDCVEVALNIPLNKTFTYQIPQERGAWSVGSRVTVPVGSRSTDGFIVKALGKDWAKDSTLILKEVTEVSPNCQIPPKLLAFYQWLARYYLYPLGKVFHEAIPLTWGVKPKREPRLSSTSASQREWRSSQHQLNNEQQNAVEKIQAALDLGAFQSLLLDGITGSGKTEVYFHSIKHALNQNKNALLLVPEIGLTPQLLERFQAFFNTQGLIYHSGLTPNQRQWTLWKARERMLQKEPFVVIGTRSAVLLPADYNFIVIDEEHDTSYKQNDHLRYHARDVALARGHHFDFPVVCGSATPSLESFRKISEGSHLKLCARPLNSQLPKITLIDLKKEPWNAGMITPTLQEEIQKNLSRKEQTILFLNRRGFSPTLFCQECGHVCKCLNCDIALTFAKGQNRLRCHYCGLEEPTPFSCPSCHQPELLPVGAGTERVEEMIRQCFPSANIARFDRDSITNPKKLNDTLLDLQNQKIDILIGTQMIAKGHDFPGVTLVGILCADSYLHFPDFRASERTFQLLTQVSGRAGRADRPGRVFIQTYQPEHSAIQAVVSGARESWIQQELDLRDDHEYPPFTRLMLVHFESRFEQLLQKTAFQIKKSLPVSQDIKILGPIFSPLAKIKNKYRMQLLLKCKNSNLLHQYLEQALLPQIQNLKNIHAFVDVDPLHLL